MKKAIQLQDARFSLKLKAICHQGTLINKQKTKTKIRVNQVKKILIVLSKILQVPVQVDKHLYKLRSKLIHHQMKWTHNKVKMKVKCLGKMEGFINTVNNKKTHILKNILLIRNHIILKYFDKRLKQMLERVSTNDIVITLHKC